MDGAGASLELARIARIARTACGASQSNEGAETPDIFNRQHYDTRVTEAWQASVSGRERRQLGCDFIIL